MERLVNDPAALVREAEAELSIPLFPNEDWKAEFLDSMEDSREFTELLMEASWADIVERKEDAAAPVRVRVEVMSSLMLMSVMVVWEKTGWAERRRATRARACLIEVTILEFAELILDWESGIWKVIEETCDGFMNY